ncbi:redoxin domain-containing protein [Marinimicrobium alkaliphilum]|uniref:redoxin domain-containing protein n=1 Tax=Marinimicrobium alkaliphilum TaxID=2202654 RepID=UPI000DB94DB2|nr:redoxin domain-containing protein [Marinimicrobium alkaliphilum]
MKATSTLLAITLWACSGAALAAAVPGEAVPDFSVVDAEGNTHTQADYEGSWLVVEWFNKDCPFVKKHYTGSDNMPQTQAFARDNDVEWLTVISSNVGTQGYLEPAQALSVAQEYNLQASAPFLLDVSGDMGRAFDARVTPHMYVINPQGTVVYAGAIDSNSSANPAVIPESTNYVQQALEESLAGQAVSVPVTQAYGCTVKY